MMATMLNPDDEFVRNLKKRIKQKNKFCPNQEARSKDTKCPCLLFRETEQCLCGLYIKVLDYE